MLDHLILSGSVSTKSSDFLRGRAAGMGNGAARRPRPSGLERLFKVVGNDDNEISKVKALHTVRHSSVDAALPLKNLQRRADAVGCLSVLSDGRALDKLSRSSAHQLTKQFLARPRGELACTVRSNAFEI